MLYFEILILFFLMFTMRFYFVLLHIIAEFTCESKYPPRILPTNRTDHFKFIIGNYILTFYYNSANSILKYLDIKNSECDYLTKESFHDFLGDFEISSNVNICQSHDACYFYSDDKITYLRLEYSRNLEKNEEEFKELFELVKKLIQSHNHPAKSARN